MSDTRQEQPIALCRCDTELRDYIQSLKKADERRRMKAVDAEKRITELEAKLKAAEAWKAEARELLSKARWVSRLPDWVEDMEFRRDALLAQEGGE